MTPFFVLTKIVTLQVPTFSPLIEEPETLQNRADFGETLSETLDVFDKTSFAMEANDFELVSLAINTRGDEIDSAFVVPNIASCL